MQRSRLKNIINISKGISNKKEVVGDPFDRFLETLPKELIVGEDYRMKAAWKAYGSPKDYKEALWEGMIQPIDENTYKLPSIGYNEETDEYEYLNKGKENETVAKDIRVWDNDVIPFVQELKRGGFIRVYNEEKDCWTYSKNKPQQEVDFFQKGGKSTKKEKNLKSYYEFLATLPKNLQSGNDTDTPEGYRMKLLFDSEPELWTFQDGLKGEKPIFTLENDGYHAPTVNRDGQFLKSYKHPTISKELEWFNNSPEGRKFAETHDLVTKDDKGNPLTYYKYVKKNPQSFKTGGEFSVIPEGALHARKNNMEGAGEDFTAKGIPVVDNEGEQQAEIERDEIIFRKEVTDKMEELYKKFNSEESQSKKDEIAIEMGKIITCEITKHTDDKTGLIDKVQEGM